MAGEAAPQGPDGSEDPRNWEAEVPARDPRFHKN